MGMAQATFGLLWIGVLTLTMFPVTVFFIAKDVINYFKKLRTCKGDK